MTKLIYVRHSHAFYDSHIFSVFLPVKHELLHNTVYFVYFSLKYSQNMKLLLSYVTSHTKIDKKKYR